MMTYDLQRASLRLLVTLALALPAPCHSARAQERGGGETAPRRPWRILDSVRLEEHVGPFRYAYRLQVGQTALDTIASVLPPFPVLTGDSLLTGFVYGPKEELVRFFRYNTRTRKVNLFPVPADWRWDDIICVSPDAQHLAYIAVDSNYLTFAAVREWPDGKLLVRGPGLKGYPSDADFDGTRWLDSDRFEIAIREDDDYRWVVVRGRVSTRAFGVDKVDAQPAWPIEGRRYCPGT